MHEILSVSAIIFYVSRVCFGDKGMFSSYAVSIVFGAWNGMVIV